MTVFWDKKCNHFIYYLHVRKTFITPAVLTSKMIREEIKYRKSLHCQIKGIKASLISTLIYVRSVH